MSTAPGRALRIELADAEDADRESTTSSEALYIRYSCVECTERCLGGRCAGCLHVRYCSVACQREGWRRGHDELCSVAPGWWPTSASLRNASVDDAMHVLAEFGPKHPKDASAVRCLVLQPAICRGELSESQARMLCDLLWISLAAGTKHTGPWLECELWAAELSCTLAKNASYVSIVRETGLEEQIKKARELSVLHRKFGRWFKRESVDEAISAAGARHWRWVRMAQLLPYGVNESYDTQFRVARADRIAHRLVAR